jgi:hypothetical protein
MRGPTSVSSEQLDRLFNEFVLAGLSEQEVSAARKLEATLTSQLSDAIDNLRGLAADREGREALAKALQEGLRDG